MLGFGFSKLLVLVLVVGAIWYFLKSTNSAKRMPPGADRRQTRGPGGAPGQSRRIEAEDMVRCPVCGTYVAANGARSCGRDDCPYGR